MQFRGPAWIWLSIWNPMSLCKKFLFSRNNTCIRPRRWWWQRYLSTETNIRDFFLKYLFGSAKRRFMHKCHVWVDLVFFFISKNKSYMLQVMQQTKDWVCLCVKDFFKLTIICPSHTHRIWLFSNRRPKQ